MNTVTMGESNGLRLENWLKKLLREKIVPGLVWTNETEETFKIPWANQKSSDWKPDQEDSRVLVEWAKHKYDFKLGQKVDLPRWKTNLRCAINKCPNIERLKNNDTKLHLICKFVSQSNTINDSPESSSSHNSSGYYSCVETPDEMIMGQDFLLDSPPDGTDIFLPTFLQGSEMLSFEGMPEFNSTSLAADDDVMESESQSLTNQPVELLELEYFTAEQPQTFNLDSTSAYYTQEYPPDGNLELVFAQSAESAAQSTEPAAQSTEPAAQSTEPAAQSTEPAAQSTEPAAQSTEPSAQSVKPEEKASPIFILEVAYDVPHRPVMSLSIGQTTPRCRIFSGTLFRKLILNEVIPPDKAELEVELCSVENLPDLPEKNRTKISDILGTFERGMGLYYDENHDIWAERRSAIKIFYSDEQNFSKCLPRKKSSDPSLYQFVKIFEYSQFLQALNMYFHCQDRSLPCPKDYVLLTVGHEPELHCPSPLRRVLVHIRVRHIQASKDLVYLSGGEGVSSNPNSMYSLPDSLDKVVSAMTDLAIDQQQNH